VKNNLISARAIERVSATVVIVALAGLLALPTGGCKSASRSDAPQDGFTTGAGRAPNAQTMYALSRILASQGRERECIAVLSQVTRQYPQFLAAYNDLAEAYLRLDRKEDAIAVLQDGLKEAPQDPVLLNNLGMCWLLREDYSQALRYFEQASMVRPEDPTYKANQAAALGMLGRTGEASEIYSRLMEPPDVRHNMSVLAQARDGGPSAELPTTAPTQEQSDQKDAAEATEQPAQN
jgi:Flp pilus assembly protein TadD